MRHDRDRQAVQRGRGRSSCLHSGQDRDTARPARSRGADSAACGSQGNDLTGRWPLRSFLELGALPSAVPCARLHARQVLWEWRLTGLIWTARNWWSRRW